ncbi:hypothetical protein INR49_013026 [Caranx melampygus]|nr:hypothetical protein INR49_013026 [Caranx melampygus]
MESGACAVGLDCCSPRQGGPYQALHAQEYIDFPACAALDAITFVGWLKVMGRSVERALEEEGGSLAE